MSYHEEPSRKKMQLALYATLLAQCYLLNQKQEDMYHRQQTSRKSQKHMHCL